MLEHVCIEIGLITFTILFPILFIVVGFAISKMNSRNNKNKMGFIEVLWTSMLLTLLSISFIEGIYLLFHFIFS